MTKKEQRLEIPSYEEGNEFGAPGGPTPMEWVLFALGAVWRRKVLWTATCLLCIGVIIAYYRTRTPLYHVETKILAQRQQQALPSIARPTVTDDVPTRSAWDLVHRRENLVALIEQTKLLADTSVASKGRRTLSPLPLLRKVLKTSSEEENPLDELVLRLDRSLHVTTGEGTIVIALDWPDPQKAYQLVEAALRNFLEARHVQEITVIDGVIAILQGRVTEMRAQVEATIAESRRASATAAATAMPSSDDSSRLALARSQQQPNEEVTRLKSILDSKIRAIQDLEEFRRRRLADAQAQLDQMRGIYSDEFPGVINLRQELDSLSRESPQVAALQDEVRGLQQEYMSRLAQEGRSPTADPSLVRARRPRSPGTSASMEDSERIREARARYEQMVERLSAAQLDLDAARAAFKNRYNVIWPAQLPREPVSPNPRKIFGLGVPASLAFALFVVALLDLLAGRIVVRWQIERKLDLPIIGELER